MNPLLPININQLLARQNSVLFFKLGFQIVKSNRCHKLGLANNTGNVNFHWGLFILFKYKNDRSQTNHFFKLLKTRYEGFLELTILLNMRFFFTLNLSQAYKH